jgi:catechol 2,3-dioxygenase-like lactoylglutathione lyase family enzyme
MPYHLRIARPVSDLATTTEMYCRGLNIQVIDKFDNHDGFDGVMLGAPDADYHFEFTRSRNHPVRPTPTVEDLTVFYIPSVPEWHAGCARMTAAGFKQVASHNPYWGVGGCTFEDRDGYRIVLQLGYWNNEGHP